MHLLDDVAPAHTRVVGAERYLALLRRVWDYALLGAAEVVVEQILEPHARDEEEVPAILSPFLYVFKRTVSRNLAVVLSARAERLVEFLEQIGDAEVSRRLERIIVL